MSQARIPNTNEDVARLTRYIKTGMRDLDRRKPKPGTLFHDDSERPPAELNEGRIIRVGPEGDRSVQISLNGGWRVIGAGGSTFTITNLTTDRAYDANATTLNEVADVLGTLLTDLGLT